jgi:hypothetical protein
MNSQVVIARFNRAIQYSETPVSLTSAAGC